MVNNVTAVVQSVFHSIINDNPISGICIVEDLKKVPENYKAIEKTFDQDQDADLWRDSGFFKKRLTRYLCISKSSDLSNLVIDKILIINEKEVPPIGFSCTYRTVDSGQKAWRKNQLCFRLIDKKSATKVITDILVCCYARSFSNNINYVGVLNGLYVYVKMGNTSSSDPATPNLSPYPSVKATDNSETVSLPADDRPQPQPSSQPSLSKTNTLGAYITGLEGVQFELSDLMKQLLNKNQDGVPAVRNRTIEDLDAEYSYDFKLENDILTQYFG